MTEVVRAADWLKTSTIYHPGNEAEQRRAVDKAASVLERLMRQDDEKNVTPDQRAYWDTPRDPDNYYNKLIRKIRQEGREFDPEFFSDKFDEIYAIESEGPWQGGMCPYTYFTKDLRVIRCLLKNGKEMVFQGVYQLYHGNLSAMFYITIFPEVIEEAKNSDPDLFKSMHLFNSFQLYYDVLAQNFQRRKEWVAQNGPRIEKFKQKIERKRKRDGFWFEKSKKK